MWARYWAPEWRVRYSEGGQLTEVLLQPHAMRSISLRTTESLNKMRAQVNISTLKPHTDLAVLETTALHVSLILITVRAAQLGSECPLSIVISL